MLLTYSCKRARCLQLIVLQNWDASRYTTGAKPGRTNSLELNVENSLISITHSKIGQSMATTQQYAGFLTRFAAALLDGIILAIINSIISFIVAAVLGTVLGGSESAAALAGVLVSLVGFVIGWLYYAFQESSPKQATIGKQALGIVVTDLDNRQISFGKATLRYFAKILSGLILLIGYIMAAFTERKQALHDLLAGTLVVPRR